MGLMVSLNICEKKALVIGGGEVALRKAKLLIRHGALVTVIAPKMNDRFEELTYNLKKRTYQPGDEEGFFVVVCATDDHALNKQVYDMCDKKGILCLSVGNASHFTVNASEKVEGICIGVTTNGKDPGFAKYLCTRLTEKIDEDMLQRFEAHAELRKAVLNKQIKNKDDHELLRRSLCMDTSEIKAILQRGEE